MRNNLAIAAAVAALIACAAGLGATIYLVWPSDAPSASASSPAFTPLVEPEVGQSAPEQAPPTEFVGPVPNLDEQDTSETDQKKVKPAPPKRTTKSGPRYKPAVLQVVTNFEQADVKVNGLPYPEYYAPGEPEGMVLPAGGPYNVEVKFGANTKIYNLHLRPHETRLLLVELSGYNSSAPPPPPQPKKKAEPAKKEEKKEEEKKDEKESGGKITVYSKPAGTVIVDGKETGEKTPGSVELENGRHEVQVKYDSGSVSEKKIVRVRNGSRIKLFFRERKK